MLLARRDALRKALQVEFSESNSELLATGDAVDHALESSNEEMSSQLAEFESRELIEIDRALARIRAGEYGICEDCDGAILSARLKALPHATLCIQCQRAREMEGRPASEFDRGMFFDNLVVEDDHPSLDNLNIDHL